MAGREGWREHRGTSNEGARSAQVAPRQQKTWKDLGKAIEGDYFAEAIDVRHAGCPRSLSAL